MPGVLRGDRGKRIVALSKPCMFEESLEKIKFRGFPKRVVPGILLLQSVDYFGTSDHTLLYDLISKTAMVGS